MAIEFRVLTISGEIASGKSTLANILAEELGWKRVNTGDRFRDFLKQKGQSVQDVSYLPDEIHKSFDSYQKEIARTEKNIILEGRLSGWLAYGIPGVYKVFCTASVEVRAERYKERENVSIEKAISEIKYRDIRDTKKYKKMYGAATNYRDPKFYDIVLDTSTDSPQELANLIISKISQDLS